MSLLLVRKRLKPIEPLSSYFCGGFEAFWFIFSYIFGHEYSLTYTTKKCYKFLRKPMKVKEYIETQIYLYIFWGSNALSNTNYDQMKVLNILDI